MVPVPVNSSQTDILVNELFKKKKNIPQEMKSRLLSSRSAFRRLVTVPRGGLDRDGGPLLHARRRRAGEALGRLASDLQNRTPHLLGTSQGGTPDKIRQDPSHFEAPVSYSMRRQRNNVEERSYS